MPDLRFIGTTVGGRLGRTFAAYGLGQGVNLLSQIFSVPLLIGAWGLPVYTDWLFAFAVPSFFTLADLGFGQAVGSELGKLWAANKHEEAVKVYQAGLTVVLGSCFICGLVFIPLIYILPFRHALNITTLSVPLTRELLTIFTLQVLIAQILGVIKMVFRTHGLESLSVTLSSLNGIGTFAAVILTSAIHGTPLGLALMSFAVSLVVTGLVFVEGRRRVGWLKPGLCRVTWASVRPILAPGVGMNLINLAQGLGLNGTFLAVGSALGPHAGVIFSTTRTLTRVINQLTNMVTYTFTVEFSTVLGAGNFDLAKKLHHRASQVSLWMAIVTSVLLLLVGKPIYLIWTKHTAQFSTPLFLLLLLSLVITAAYGGSIGVPISVNKHLKMSIYFCFASTLAMGICWIGARTLGLPGAGIGVLALAVIMLFVVVPIALRIAHDNFDEWLKAMISPDFRWLLARLRGKRSSG